MSSTVLEKRLYLMACVICLTTRLSMQYQQPQEKEINNDDYVVMQETTFLEHHEEGWFEQGCS